MNARETHFRERLVAFCYAVQNLAVITGQGTPHGADLIDEGIATPKFDTERPSETELFTEQIRSCRKVSVIPNARIKGLNKIRSAHAINLPD
jgi:hypothetical protein